MLWQPDSEGHVYHFTLPEGHKNENVMWLHWIVRLRSVAVVAQVLTYGLTYKVLAGPGVLAGLLATSGLLALVNAYNAGVLEREEDIDNGYVLGQLTIDVVALTALFALAGGTANPFVPLYLVHVAMGMIVLTAGHAVVLGTVILLCYSSLFVVHWPLHLDRHGIPEWLLAPLGQWIAFAITVFSVGMFVLGTANSLRKHRARSHAQPMGHAHGDEHPAHEAH